MVHNIIWWPESQVEFASEGTQRPARDPGTAAVVARCRAQRLCDSSVMLCVIGHLEPTGADPHDGCRRGETHHPQMGRCLQREDAYFVASFPAVQADKLRLWSKPRKTGMRLGGGTRWPLGCEFRHLRYPRNSSKVSPDCHIMERSVPRAISLWFGTVILLCG